MNWRLRSSKFLKEQVPAGFSKARRTSRARGQSPVFLIFRGTAAPEGDRRAMAGGLNAYFLANHFCDCAILSDCGLIFFPLLLTFARVMSLASLGVEWGGGHRIRENQE